VHRVFQLVFRFGATNHIDRLVVFVVVVFLTFGVGGVDAVLGQVFGLESV
jgi:hypothetical protein